MNVTSFLYDSNYMPSAPVIKMLVHARSSVEVIALVDSGADATIIPINLLRKIGATYVKAQQMRGIIGRSQEVDLYLVTIQISIHRLPGIRVIAANPGTEIILGRDVLNHLIVALNGLAGVTEIEI